MLLRASQVHYNSCVECRVRARAAKSIKAQLTAQVDDLKKEVKDLKDLIEKKVNILEKQIQGMVTNMDNYVRIERKSDHVDLMKKLIKLQ